MAQHLANGLSEDSPSEYASSTAGTDPLEDFLDRYTFRVNPECCLKLHKSCGTARLGANCFFRLGGSRRWTFVAKPADKTGNPWLHKLTVAPSQSLLQVSTAKKQIGSWLRLQVTADFDWETRRAGMHWRVSTKWNAGRNKLERKEKLRLADGVELRPHWRMDVYMPEVEGRLGSAAREGEDGVRVERGHCHITVPRVDLVLPLDALARRARQLTARGRILPEPGTEPDSARATSAGALGTAAAAKPAPPARQAPGQAGRFQWHRSGRAVGDAIELPAAPAGGEAPPWKRLMLRVQARLPKFASDHSIGA